MKNQSYVCTSAISEDVVTLLISSISVLCYDDACLSDIFSRLQGNDYVKN